MTDEGNAFSTYEGLSKLCIIYKHKETLMKNKRILQDKPLFVQTSSPSSTAKAVPLPLNGKAQFGSNSPTVCIFKLPDKSKFETEHDKCEQGTNYTLQEFQEEVSFKRKVNLFAEGDDLKVHAES